MRMERTKNAKRNIVFGFVLKVYQILVPFLMRTAIIYILGIQYLGLNGLFTSILSVLNLAELGVGSAMIFSMYKPIAENDTYTICALMRLYKIYYRIIGLVVAVIGIIITPVVPYLVKGTIPAELNIYVLYLLNLSVTVLSYWLFAYKNSIILAHQRTDVISKVTLVTNTIQYVLQIVVLICWKNYYLYVIVMLLTQVLTNIVTAVVSSKMYPEYKAGGGLDKEEEKKIRKRIRDLFTAKLGGVILNSADTIVISAFLGLTTLAVYQNYFFIMNSVCGVIFVIFSAITAGLGNSFVTETADKNYRDLKKFTFLICWLLCVCSSLLIGMYQPFMELWVGKEHMLSYAMVILFCVYFYLYELALVWVTIKDAAGLWNKDRFRPLISSIFNLVLNILLIDYWGLYGVVISTIASHALIAIPWLIHNIFTLIYKRSAYSYVVQLLKYLIVSVLSVSLTALTTYWIGGNVIIRLLLGACIAFFISNLLQFLFFKKDETMKEAKQLVKKMLKR